MSRFLIYALHNDRSDRIYIGQSSRGLTRPRDHGRPAYLRQYPNTPVSKWIKKHGSYQIHILEKCNTRHDLDEAERFYIGYFRSIGAQLLNLTDGGDGWTPTTEQRARISATMKGRQLDQEHRRHLSLAAIGKKKTPAHRANLGLAQIGRQQTDCVRTALSAAHKGKKKSPEEITKSRRTRQLRGRGIIPDPLRTLDPTVLHAWRISLGLTQNQVGSLAGLSRNTISRLERRRT